MTELLRELRLRKRDEALRTAPIQANGKPREGSDLYRQKLANTAAKARAALRVSELKDELRAYEYGDAAAVVCFLCADPFGDDEIAVQTSLGPIHQSRQEKLG
jgi:hypothetical protein